MEENIKVIRPKILKSDSEDSFFMVNKDWLNINKKLIKDHSLTVEFPKEDFSKIQSGDSKKVKDLDSKQSKTFEVEKEILETKTDKL